MTRFTCWLCLFCCLTLLAPAAMAASLPDACETPRVLLPSDTLRPVAGRVGEIHCYRLDLPAPGLLHLDVSAAGWKPSRARWRLFAAEGMSPWGERTLERWAGEYLALAAAGTWYLEIAAEDPRRALPAYRLSSRFLESAGPVATLPTKDGENEGELEPDPETLTVGGCRTAKDGENEGELEPDPETTPLLACVPREALCSHDAHDDHADTFACATALVGRAAGELGNDWGDDVDVFRFHLSAWRTVEVVSAADVDAHAALYDHTGQRLTGSGDDNEGGDVRLVRTLGPGVYFVRLEQMGAPGAYTLQVLDLDDSATGR